jgi:ATP-binding cassette subfamily B protein
VRAEAGLPARGRLWRNLGAVTWELVAGSPWAAAFLGLVLLVGNASAGAMAAATGGFVGAAVRGSPRAAAAWLGVYVAAALAEQFYWNFKNLAAALMRDQGVHRLLGRILRRAARAPLREFEDPAFHDAMQRAAAGLPDRLHRLQYTVTDLVQLGVSTASLGVVLGAIQPGLLLVLAAGTLPAAGLQARAGGLMVAAEREDTRRGRVRGRLAHLLAGREAAAELRLFGAAPFLLERWRTLRAARTRSVLAAERRVQAAATASNLLTGFAYVVCLAWVAWDILHGRMRIGSYVAVTVAAVGFAERLGAVVEVVRGADEEAQHLGDFTAFAHWAGGRGEAPPAPPAPPAPGSRSDPAVRVRGLRFRYPSGPKPVLDGVDLDIAPGERVALVGPNGAGKTTLAKCLLGLYAPEEGSVTVGGLPAGEARGQVAAVFQDYVRYQLTLREAVGFGDLARLHDDGAILGALGRAGLGDLPDRLPGGLAGHLGREFGGTDLSGGQWQRLAMARALFREARLLVLDEPAAALDPMAELALFERFAELAAGRTAVMISHRLGAARVADRVVVLEGGRIAEQGAHGDLVARGGPYARLFAAQARWYREGAGEPG